MAKYSKYKKNMLAENMFIVYTVGTVKLRNHPTTAPASTSLVLSSILALPDNPGQA